MISIVRLVTIHPVLTHFTIGGLPLILIAYTIAVWLRSPLWTLVGDAALVVTSTLTLLTAAFGLVSNFVLPWPGGLEIWRWIHLGCGLTTAVVLGALAGLRLAYRRSGTAARSPVLMVALIGAGLALFTGWVGGEVLVFQSGMAVRAAGDGALAPPVGRPEPKNVLAAMREVRASWASTQTDLAWMLVHHPRDEDFRPIETDVRWMEQMTGRMAEVGAKAPKSAKTLGSMSEALGGGADDIATAAKKASLQEIAHSVDETSGTCADCHEAVRWK